MDAIAHLAGAFALFALFMHMATTLSARRRCKVPGKLIPVPENAPPITIVRTVCGADPFEERTLASSFALDYPSYEVLFCIASADDPGVARVQSLMAAHPNVRARLLIGDDRISSNPKLNNMVKGWGAAAHEWIVFADSNVDLPRDYLQRLLAAWREDTGMVSAPPIGCQPQGVAAEFECAFLNTYQARWQYAADSLGIGYAQGKNMLWRRKDLEAGGGIEALAREPAEDAASTVVVRGLGLRVHLADGAFPQPLGRRTASGVWGRQVRWARLRKVTFPGLFGTEILSGLVAPLVGLVAWLWSLEFDETDVFAAVCGYVLIWFAAEAWLALSVGWHISWRSPLLWMLRELLLPILVLQAWLGTSSRWRDNDLAAADNAGLRPGALRS
jgi:ceramide glucosyltransferase